MKNPWLQLPERAPFVLPQDRDVVEHFNRTAAEARRFRVEVLPEPFLGSPTAPVLLLNLNPGFSEKNLEEHRRTDFVRASRGQLRHARQPYPFFLLDPALEFAAGHRWWKSKLRALIAEVGQVEVARTVLCVEFFPYHSARSGITERLAVESQQYGFHLVKQAMTRNAVVVLLRAKRLWFHAIPELQSYGSLHRLRSPQNVAVTPRNCPSGFDSIVRAIRGQRAQAA